MVNGGGFTKNMVECQNANPGSPRTTAPRQPVFIGSFGKQGILAFDWDPVYGALEQVGVAAEMDHVDWITFSPGHKYLYAASEVDSFNGKPTGGVASFRVSNGQLKLLTTQNSAGEGTCHVAVDKSGRVLLSADYGGGSAASFLITEGQLSPAVWSVHYPAVGHRTNHQESAHAHFGSFSPDNCFAYINDLGGDCIHIYGVNSDTAWLTPAGQYQARPGAGPRTLHFHPNGHTAFSVNELDSTVDVLEWSAADGMLTLSEIVELLPEGYKGATRACDAVISKDGRHVYFANRDNDFLYSFNFDLETGRLKPIGRSPSGGKSPRHFVLDPTERWMLVANEDSNLVSIFERNPDTGALSDSHKSVETIAPMCILFV
jgi:6-phosphogluconolactonase